MQDSINLTFEQVIEANKSKIFRICKVYAVTPIEPEDLFQEVIFHIWKSFRTFEGKASINTWVYRITLNVCLRQKKNLQRKQSNVISLDAIQFQLSEQLPDTWLEERQKALYVCLRSLDELDQTIVIMVLDGVPYKEISETTGLTQNHIAVKMKRMKKTLLTCMTSKIQKDEK